MNLPLKVLFAAAAVLIAVSSVSAMPDAISYLDAKALAQEATRVYYSDLTAIDTDGKLENGFYLFEILWKHQGQDASPHFGAFAVDIRTADVWNVAGNCTLLSSKALRRLKREVLGRSKLTTEIRRHSRKPMCDAS